MTPQVGRGTAIVIHVVSLTYIVAGWHLMASFLAFLFAGAVVDMAIARSSR